MKKSISVFFMSILYFITLLGVGLPHSVYFQVYSIDDTTVVYPDTISFKSWVIGRENEILTEKSFGCSYNKEHSYVGVQVGNFKTPWSGGEKLEIEVYSNLGNASKIITITNEGAQWFVKNYQGKEGIRVSKEKKDVSTTLLSTKSSPQSVTFTFNIQAGESATLSIYDKKMKLIKKIDLTSKDKSYVFNTKKLPAGLYFYKLQSPACNQTKKLVIIKSD